MKIAITGIGAISSIGNNVSENFDALKSEKSGISVVENVEQLKKTYFGGEIKQSNAELAELAGVSEFENISRTTLLGLIAAKEAFKASNSTLKTGLISASSVGGMDLSEGFYKDVVKNGDFSKKEVLKSHDIGAGADFIAKALGIKGYITSISTACSSSANAVMLGARMILSGQLDQVLVGGMDALSAFTMNGFDSLMIYDAEQVKPFDQNRAGVNLGEGAGFVLLEGEKALATSKNKPLAYVKGWANANDAYHQTASSPEGSGAQKAIKEALNKSGLQPEDISFVNAHGTGTGNNDLSESNALSAVFSDVPPFASIKGYTGHTLAACGTLELVYSVGMLQNQLVIPNVNFKTPIEETGLVPVQELTIMPISNILSNSFGFGGNNTSLIVGV